MKSLKKIIAVMLIVALMVPGMALSAFAAAPSPAKIEIGEGSVVAKSATYNGSIQKPVMTVKNKAGQVLVEGKDYVVVDGTWKDADSYTATVKGIGLYKGEKTVVYTINKAKQAVKVTSSKKVKSGKVTFKNLKKKASFTLKVSGNQGKVTYKLAKKNSKISVSKKGKVTLKKGIKKGTYKVKVTVKGNGNFKSYTKTIKVVVK